MCSNFQAANIFDICNLGTIPSAIGSFTYLTNLDIGGNYWTSIMICFINIYNFLSRLSIKLFHFQVQSRLALDH